MRFGEGCFDFVFFVDIPIGHAVATRGYCSLIGCKGPLHDSCMNKQHHLSCFSSDGFGKQDRPSDTACDNIRKRVARLFGASPGFPVFDDMMHI